MPVNLAALMNCSRLDFINLDVADWSAIENRGLRNILVAEATFLDTSRMQPRYAASERGAGYFIELFTANIRDRNP